MFLRWLRIVFQSGHGLCLERGPDGAAQIEDIGPMSRLSADTVRVIGAATESATVNRDRAPSGPVKVVVTNQPHSRPNAGIDLASGVSALLAWFPASWTCKVAPCFIGDAGVLRNRHKK